MTVTFSTDFKRAVLDCLYDGGDLQAILRLGQDFDDEARDKWVQYENGPDLGVPTAVSDDHEGFFQLRIMDKNRTEYGLTTLIDLLNNTFLKKRINMQNYSCIVTASSLQPVEERAEAILTFNYYAVRAEPI